MSKKSAPDSLFGRVRALLASNGEKAWRPAEVAEKLKEPQAKISTALSQLFSAGRLSRCEVTIPDSNRKVFEYRDKGYEKLDGFRTLKPAKATIVGRVPSAHTENTKERQSVAIPEKASRAKSETGLFDAKIKPPKGIPESSKRIAERALSKVETDPPLKISVKDRTAAFAISDDGCLGITLEDGFKAKLIPAEIASMMDFLGKTEALWR